MLICAVTMMASPVEPEQARTIALNFMTQKSPAVTRSTDCTLAYTWSNDRSTALFYVYNVGGGFVIVSADDAVKPVLGYSTKGTFTGENMPVNCRSWLRGYADEIAFVKENNLSAPEKVSQAWTALAEGREPSRSGNTRAVEPLLTTTWDQSPFYNVLCPGEGDDQAITGCVATAMAQIINYHQWPAHGMGTRLYSYGAYENIFADFGNTTYRYDLMPTELVWTYDEGIDDWIEPDPQQVNAVATLMYHCGVAANMQYSPSESGAYDEAARAGFITQFGYDAHYAEKTDDSVWIVMLKEELDQARPIFYGGKGRFWGSNGGHAFVCDGYDTEDYFHFNFGWGGLYDGYFAIGAITSEDYSYGSSIIGHEGTGFQVNNSNDAVFARPNGDTTLIPCNYGGRTTRTIYGPVQVTHVRGFNNYGATSYSNSYTNELTLYPANPGEQLKLEVLACSFTTTIYDGESTEAEQIAYNPAVGSTYISSTGALTIVISGSLRDNEHILRVEPISCLPVVQNVNCTNYNHQSATLTWEIIHRENYPNHTYNWQLEYGPQGFTPGTGTILHPTNNETSATITGLNADTYYDVYLTYDCTGGGTFTLEPFTFKTTSLANCLDPIGNGTNPDYTLIICGYYSWSQQIFTADELTASGLMAGDPISVLWIQYHGEEPLTRLFGVYMGHTEKTAFANENDFFDPVSLTNVYPVVNTTFVNTYTDYWFPLYFSNNFVWDGTSNIVIAYVNNSGTSACNQNFYSHSSTSNCTLHTYNSFNGYSPITVESGGYLTSNRLNIKFCATTNCMTPTNLTATSVSRTEVRLDWDRMYQENQWTVEYGAQGFELGTGTSVTVTAEPTTVIANLEHGTYDFYVRAECGGGNHSDWRMVSANVMGDNDCVELVEGEWTGGALVTNLENKNYAQSQQILNASDLLELGLIPGKPIYSLSIQYTKSMTLTRRMAVYMANTDKSTFANNSDWFNLGVLTNVFYEKDFSFTAKESDEDYRWITFNFDEPFIWDGSSNMVIAFADNTGNYVSVSYWDDYDYAFNQHPGNTNDALYWSGSEEPSSDASGYLSNYLSNIRFCEGCMKPIHISYTTPSRHEIIFTWQPGHEETEWRVEYGPAGFEQSAGTMVTVSGEPTLTISQLGRGSWDFYFQSDCGNGNSSVWEKVSVILGVSDVAGEPECFQIGNGSQTSQFIPFIAGYNSGRINAYTQQLFTSEELTEAGLTAGSSITSISFQYSGSSQTKSSITIYMGNSSLSSLTTSQGYVPVSEMTQVFSGAVQEEDGWFTINFSTPFTWAGSSIVLAILDNSNSYISGSIFYGHSITGRTIEMTSRYSISAENPTECTNSSFRSNITFCATTGCNLHRTIDAIVNEGDSYDFYGRTISEQGTYFHRFYVDEECDSLITLNLTVRKIIYVTPTGAGSHSGASWQHAMQLQEAMDTAASYTNVTPFIYVKKGTYTGNTSGTNSFEIRPKVRAYGGFNGNEGPYFDLNDRNLTSNVSTLNGSDSRRVLYQSEDFTTNNASLFDGFTIRGGTVDIVGEGGAAYIRKNCTLRNCKITANNSSISGETSNITRTGVVVYNNGGTLDNCQIINNSINLSGTGSGHKVWGVGVYSVGGAITNCIIRNNTTVYDGNGNNWNVYGGGVCLNNDNTVNGCEITLNSATLGGGVSTGNSSSGTLANITNCIISNNTARGNGGGIYSYPSSSGTNKFTQCLIGNNVSGDTGGGIYDGTPSTFTGCNVVRNAAASNAGGVYSQNGTTFKNSVIWGNKVGNNDNHVSIANGKYFTFVNSAFPGTYSGALTLQEENIGTGMGYPMFANPTAEAGVDATNQIGDWTPQEGSFLIGLGNNNIANTETDLAGNARIQQERVDIGAYESAYNMAFPLHPEQGSNIIYVTTTGAGSQDGSSWSNATANLQYAMDVASGYTPPATVWMAQGTYTCERPYIVQPFVAVYGSFAGNEPYTYDLTQRDFENHATILDGGRLYRVLDKTCPFSVSGTTTYYTEPVEINMPVTGTKDITACSGVIYDDGGPSNNFSPNCNGEIIIRSYNPHGTITISGSYNNNYYGRLKIYDGIGGRELCNYNYDGNLSLTSTSGVLVVQFTSSTSSLNSGFSLRFTCSDCEADVPETLVSFRNGESLFDGITVQNGYDRNGSFGGGYLLAHTDLLNCTFTNNLGSGVHAEESMIENSTFSHNGAKGIDGNKLTINNCRVNSNTNYGINGSNLDINNCLVDSNSSYGIYLSANSTLTNSIIRDNNSYGIYIYGACKINECSVIRNRTYGIYNYNNNAQVFNTSIINNNGTGLYAYGGLYVNVNVANNAGIGVNASNGAQFTNCHIVRNYYNSTSTTTGAGVSNGSAANQFTNCVIWGNMAKTRHQNISGTSATYAYCAIEGGAEGTANITLDTLNSGDEPGIFYPNFVNPSDTAGMVNGTDYNYNLAAGSACINQGIASTTSLNLPMYDLAGSLRIKQGRIDIGAYEYGGVIVNRVNDSICLGEDFWYGDEYIFPEEVGLYLDTVTYYENGQDYIAYIAIQTNPNYNQYIDTAICEGESIFFDGEERTETGEYIYYGQTESGCDSTVTLSLTVLPHSSSSFSATRCDSYTWNDETYYESGVYTQIFEAANGCDSTVTLNLTITESTEYEFEQMGCVVYNWNGITYRQSGDYVQHFRNAAGCDSTVTMHLTILDVLHTEIDTIVCDAFVWNDETYTTSGDKVQYFTSANDCDSIVTVHLTVKHSITRTERLIHCDSYTWNNETYTTSGTYQQFFIAANGCDSTVTLILTINHTNEFEFDATACDVFVWNNETYYESGDYQQILTNTGGCDSTVTLHLTIHHSNSYEFDDEACDIYIWNNETYNESGDYQQVLTNASGCDSTVTLHLTIYPTYTIPLEEAICRSQLPYTYVNGQISHTFGIGTPGQTIVSFPMNSVHGCDSIIVLTLTVNPVYDITIEETICQNDLPYHYINGEINATFGIETPAQSSVPFQLTSVNGCDSIVTLQLTVNPSYNTPLTATVCETELPYHYVNGQIDTTFEEGTPATQSTFIFNFQTTHGCDSAVTLNLTVVPVAAPQLTVTGQITACESSSATLSVAGNYTSYLWSTGATTPTISVTTPGFYWVSLIDANGCASMTEVTQLGVSTLIPETPAICMVGVENGHNLIVWEELENTNVQNYRVYRENDQANVYELLATVPASQGNAYEDVTADPSVRAYRYKVTAMDVCQSETPMSEMHKTVHLTINQGIGNSWNLIWTHYEGMEFSSYKLYRGTANNNLTLIATLPSTLTSYTDYDNVNGALFYQIEVVMNGSCLRRSTTYTGSRSNIVYNGEAVYTDTAVLACESYEWLGNTYTQSGVYQQNYTSELGYTVNAQLHLTIFTPPVFTINGETTITTGTGLTATLSVTPTNPQWTYHWSNGATTSSITVSPDETTTYTVTVTNGVCEATATGTITVVSSVNEWGTSNLHIYPNPTTGIVTIELDTETWNMEPEIQVFDVYGRMLTVVETGLAPSLQIDLSRYATGIYMLKVVNDGKVVAIGKVVKE